MLRGSTAIIAHLGYPTEVFKSPLIYNPYFEQHGIDAAVVPMGVRAEDYERVLPELFRITNLRGALVTMPHKVTTVRLMHAVTPAVRIAGSCNAILRRADGSLLGDLFDGEGFVRGLRRKGFRTAGARALVVGCGGVGSAIAAALAAAGIGCLTLHDSREFMAEALAERIAGCYPALAIRTGSNDPAGHDLVVNATPLGMAEGDALPVDVERLEPGAFAGEVVMRTQMTPFLQAARARGCEIQVGLDMLFEQIPVYLEFFGFPTTTPEALRAVARLED